MLSVIIPSLNEGKHVEEMIDNIRGTVGLADYEIVVVDSGGTELSAVKDLPQVYVYDSEREGAPQARNLGASKAKGETLVFADAHVRFPSGWGKQVLEATQKANGIVTPCITSIDDEDSRGCGFAWSNLRMDIKWLEDVDPNTHEVPFACSCCMSIPRPVFRQVGGFDAGTRFWGSEDSELSMRTWLLGFKVVCDPSMRVGHMFRDEHPYHITKFDELYNKVRFAFSHFSVQRLEHFLWGIADEPMLLDVLLEIKASNVFERRGRLLKTRVKSDDWFFDRFRMEGWPEPVPAAKKMSPQA